VTSARPSEECAQDPKKAPYRAELIASGCSGCGRGKRWKIIGPTAIDARSMDEADVIEAVDQANALYESIRQHLESQRE